MVRIYNAIFALSALVPSVLAQTCATINPQVAPVFASGYSGKVVINGLKTPRSILFDNQGNLLTTERDGYGVRYVQLTDNGGINICAKSNKQLIADSALNHGLALSADGKKLYASSNANVFSWDYDGTTGTVSNKKTLIEGMTQTGHVPKTLLLPKKQPGLLIVHRGSDGNIDTTTSQITSGKSQLRIFKIADIEKAPVQYQSGAVLSWGIRNSIAVGEDTKGGIWALDNGVDNMTRNSKDIHETNPCERLNFHGYVNSSFSSVPPSTSNNYGYPECAAVWDPSVLPAPLNSEVKVGQLIAYGTANATAMCSNRVGPKLCFPPHTAPLDIKFNANNSAAYISFHGSWNRKPANGYRLSRVVFDPATGMPKEPLTSTTAAQNIVYHKDNAACPTKCMRPVGLAWDKKGRLFMVSDTTGEVWVIGGAS